MFGAHGVPEIAPDMKGEASAPERLAAESAIIEFQRPEGRRWQDEESTPRPGKDEDAETRIAVTLANSLTQAVVEAFRRLQDDHALESRVLFDSIRQLQEKLESTCRGLQELATQHDSVIEMIDQQKKAGIGMQEKYERIRNAVTTLQGADTHHESAVRDLRREMESLSSSIFDRLDAVFGRLGFREELSGLKSTVSELSPKVASLVERLDRQAEAIRSVSEAKTLGEAALEQFVEIWTRLKASAVRFPDIGERQL